MQLWRKRGDPGVMFAGHVSADHRVTVSTSGRLEIKNVLAGDGGAYVCAALNAAGSNVARAELTIPGTPEEKQKGEWWLVDRPI